ncbi:MAG: hypothetical protein RL596_1612 [Bacteroidota bacterium]|jgi:uncharacterized LabA/DUF88 family protein
MERVVAYIDGFNLYFGMKQNGNDSLWLNVQALVKSLLKANQQLVYTKYFTSRVRNNPDKEKRQKIYIEALETLADCDIIYGHYQSHIEKCRKCGHTYPYSNEKMTDVNIAVSMMEDAFADKYETAFLISGDSDLIPPVNSIHQLFPQKRVFVAFPPNRFNVSVKNAAKGSMTIGKSSLRNTQFNNSLVNTSSYLIKRPEEWQ